MSRVPFPPPSRRPTLHHTPFASHRLSPPHRALARDASSPRVRTPPRRVAHESSSIPAFAFASPSSSSTSSSPSRNTRLDSKRNETNARTNASTRIARASDTHARTHACIIRIHPRGTTLTDHDSPPRDSIAIGGAADFARAIVISGRGCRFEESRPVVESPTPDARDRSSRRSRGCARARMVSMSPVMTRGTMCKQ